MGRSGRRLSLLFQQMNRTLPHSIDLHRLSYLSIVILTSAMGVADLLLTAIGSETHATPAVLKEKSRKHLDQVKSSFLIFLAFIWFPAFADQQRLTTWALHSEVGGKIHPVRKTMTWERYGNRPGRWWSQITNSWTHRRDFGSSKKVNEGMDGQSRGNRLLLFFMLLS